MILITYMFSHCVLLSALTYAPSPIPLTLITYHTSHTHHTGVSIVSPNTKPQEEDNSDNYRLAHFYPVMPLHYIGATRSDAEKNYGALVNTYWSSPPNPISSDGYPMQVSLSLTLRFKGILLYTVVIIFHI